MDKISIVLVTAAATTTAVLSVVYLTMSGIIPSMQVPQQLQFAYGQAVSQGNSSNATIASNATTATTSGNSLSAIHPGTDASPIAAVVFINKDVQGNVVYVPSNVTMRVGDELLVVNNGTDSQSLTNGMGPDDPNAGKFFDTGPIAPRGFAEFVGSNLSPENYPFYSTNSTSTTGVLTIQPNS